MHHMNRAEVGLDCSNLCWETRGQIQVILSHKLIALMVTSHKPGRNVVCEFFFFWCIYYLSDESKFLWHPNVRKECLLFEIKWNVSLVLPEQGWSCGETSTPLGYSWHHEPYSRPKQWVCREWLASSLLCLLLWSTPTGCWSPMLGTDALSGLLRYLPQCSSPPTSCPSWSS